MERESIPAEDRAGGLSAGRRDLVRRLDDLRGLGLLPEWSDSLHTEGEESLQRLALSLIDLLEASQRRVIESSIQLLSLRELVAELLSLRAPADFARTLTLYLHKAFDHERVLVGIYDPARETLEGWGAVRRGAPRCSAFSLGPGFGGALRDALSREEPVRSWQDDALVPLLSGADLPPCLDPFLQGAVGPYIVYPLLRAQGRSGALGVLAVARGFASPTLDGMEGEILRSLVDTVATALENLLLDEDVRREEAFRKDVMGSTAAGLVAVDLAGRVLTMNERAENLSGFRADDLRGGDLHELDTDRDGMGHMLRRTLEARRGLPRRETVLRRRDGRLVPVACTTTLLRNPQDRIYGALVTFEDLTDLREMEERIRQLDRLAALGRFTAGVAHEIRNPLAGIAAGVQYLARFLADDPDQRENLSVIQGEIERLNRIVEDLFRVTHPMPPRRSFEDAARLARQSARVLEPAFATKDVRLLVETEGETLPVPVDPDQIQQVIVNLLKNALEATPPGGEVRVVVGEASGERGPVLALRVEDSGPGVETDALPHIFEPFFTRGKSDGTGLGLYVSHGIVERHGGELLVANRTRGGAVFTVHLPLTDFDRMENVA